MPELAPLGKMFLILGGFFLLTGLILTFAGRIPLLRHLPADIIIRRERFSLYFPLVTSIILSIVLSLLLTLISGIWRLFR